MTSVHFFDDTEELLVGNAVDLILPEDSVDSAFYDNINGYEEIINMINDIVVVVDTQSFIERDKMVENYKYATKTYINPDMQDFFLNKIKVDFYKITVPFKIYLIINISWAFNLFLDNLWYYKNLNLENIEDDFVIKHNNLIQEYADFYTKLVCKCTIATHYYLYSDIYKRIKEDYEYLEQPKLWITWILHDHKLPLLREFLWWLECYDRWEKVKMMWWAKDFVPPIVEAWAYKIEKEEYKNHHFVLDYIIFSLIFLKKAPLLIVSKEYINIELWIWYDVYLTNNEWIIKEFVNSWSSFVVINPFQGLDKLIEEETDEKWKSIIKEWREKYQEIRNDKSSTEEKVDKCMKFICEQLKTYEKVEFKINTKNQQPYSITQIVTQCNPDKFYETKESFTNPVKTTSIEDPGKKERRIYESTKPLSEI